jgi:hypothetical protein
MFHGPNPYTNEPVFFKQLLEMIEKTGAIRQKFLGIL